MTSNNLKDISATRFIVADDKAFIRNLVGTMLLRSGARHIARAESGAEAIDLLRNSGGQYDCLISDWNMEPVSGLELLQKIRSGQVEHTAPDLCFILLTGSGHADVVNTAIALDVNAYLVKPVSQDKFVKAITRARERTWSLRPASYYRAVQGVAPSHLNEGPERPMPLTA